VCMRSTTTLAAWSLTGRTWGSSRKTRISCVGIYLCWQSDYLVYFVHVLSLNLFLILLHGQLFSCT
jgi:hypothetical protein